MKTKDELNAKIAQLTDEELVQVTGGKEEVVHPTTTEDDTITMRIVPLANDGK